MLAVFTLERLAFDVAKADADGAQNAGLDQRADFVDAWRDAFRRQLQMAAQRLVFDAQVMPAADNRVRIVIKQRDRVFEKALELPALRADDVAHPIERLVAERKVAQVLDIWRL